MCYKSPIRIHSLFLLNSQFNVQTKKYLLADHVPVKSLPNDSVFGR